MRGAKHTRRHTRQRLDASCGKVESSPDHQERRREGHDHQRRGFDQDDLRIAYRQKLRGQDTEDRADDDQNAHTHKRLPIADPKSRQPVQHDVDGSLLPLPLWIGINVLRYLCHTHDDASTFSTRDSEKANASTSLSSG